MMSLRKSVHLLKISWIACKTIMEKLRLFVFSFILLLGGILIFSFTKSWFVYDRGIEVILIEEEKKSEEDTTSEIDKKATFEDWQENSRIHFKNTLVYPVGLNNESGGLGPDGIMHHAKNLIVVNLKSGRKIKLFRKSVYIWDYFNAEFSKKTGFTSSDEPRMDVLSLDGKIIIFAATQDTNMDGFLNNKDRKRVFLFDVNTDKILDILPKETFFEKIVWNAGKNRLVLVIRKMIQDEEKKSVEFSQPQLFIYDASSNKSIIVEISD